MHHTMILLCQQVSLPAECVRDKNNDTILTINWRRCTVTCVHWLRVERICMYFLVIKRSMDSFVS